jgi:hypothetical protein
MDLPPASLGSAISSDGSAGDDISQITVITENEGKDKVTLVRPLGVHAPIWDHFKVLIQESRIKFNLNFLKEIIIFKHILFTSYKVWSKCPNLTVCNLCKATIQRIDGNTSHMNGHVDRKHPEVTAKKRELKAQAQLDEKKGFKNTVQTSILGHMQPFPDFQDKLLNWVVSTYQPFDVVTEDSFREMVGSISNNKAPIIGKDTIRNLVHDKVAYAKLLLKNQLVGQS